MLFGAFVREECLEGNELGKLLEKYNKAMFPIVMYFLMRRCHGYLESIFKLGMRTTIQILQLDPGVLGCWVPYHITGYISLVAFSVGYTRSHPQGALLG